MLTRGYFWLVVARELIGAMGYPKIPLKGKNSSHQEWPRTKLVLGPGVVDL